MLSRATKSDQLYRFSCDGCGRQLYAHMSEQSALEGARQLAHSEGWKWSHPGWGLTCPGCLKSSQGT